MLCDSWDSDYIVNESYIQEIEKPDRTSVDPYIRKAKHILLWADAYGVEPDLDIAKFKQSINEKIRTESVVKKTDQIYGVDNITGWIMFYSKQFCDDSNRLKDFIENNRFYISVYYDCSENKDDPDEPIVTLREDRFRIVTAIDNKTIVSYPEMINKHCSNIKRIRDYKMSKFNILNRYLVSKTTV